MLSYNNTYTSGHTVYTCTHTHTCQVVALPTIIAAIVALTRVATDDDITNAADSSPHSEIARLRQNTYIAAGWTISVAALSTIVEATIAAVFCFLGVQLLDLEVSTFMVVVSQHYSLTVKQ